MERTALQRGSRRMSAASRICSDVDGFFMLPSVPVNVRLSGWLDGWLEGDQDCLALVLESRELFPPARLRASRARAPQ